MRNKLFQTVCKNCGAPLSKDRQRGKHICEYCGAVFYAELSPGETWIPDVCPEPELLRSNEPQQNLAEKTKNKTNKTLIIGFVIFASGVLCILGAILSFTSDGGTPGFGATVGEMQKPEMLATLPKSAKAGESIAYKSWEIVVEPDVDLSNTQINLTLRLTNWNDREQEFQYIPSEMIVYDDLGNRYPINLGYCEEDLPYLPRKIVIGSYDEIILNSSDSWCRSYSDGIPSFRGVLPYEADHLYIRLQNFGVFEGITFVIEL